MPRDTVNDISSAQDNIYVQVSPAVRLVSHDFRSETKSSKAKLASKAGGIGAHNLIPDLLEQSEK